MPIPPNAATCAQKLDPHEEIEFVAEVAPLLETGESVASAGWTLALGAEAVALGLTIMTGAGRDPGYDVTLDEISFWLTVAPAYQTNAAFAGEGSSLPVEITLTTDAVPARKRQRTLLVKVAQQ